MLTEDDVNLFDRAIVESIPLEATTRSKLGQTPRIYLRVEYKNDRAFIGDLRQYVSLEKEEGLRDISEVNINFSTLKNKLSEWSDKIEKIYLWVHPDLEEKILGTLGINKDENNKFYLDGIEVISLKNMA